MEDYLIEARKLFKKYKAISASVLMRKLKLNASTAEKIVNIIKREACQAELHINEGSESL